MDKFAAQIKNFTGRAVAHGFKIVGEKKINYGVQLKITDGENEAGVNIYNGKKGITFVVQGAATALKTSLESLVAGGAPPPAPETIVTATPHKSDRPHGFENVAGFDGKWIGIDESGKGDFFGPLVVAAVMLDTTTAAQLEKMGVRDSKKTSDKKNAELAAHIRQICRDRYAEIKFCPAKYNELYTAFSAEGKNLNNLLGYAHAQTLENLLEKEPCRFALADKFGAEHFTQNELLKKGREIMLLQLPRGEQNIAVAAASVLARDAFLTEMEKMRSRFAQNFPKGAVDVVAAARLFAAQHGRASLPLVCKTHFKTYQQL
ncbi:MAG: ribonuclease HIII [Sporomusaceae bacterium]|jgi:ribonuclease HIII|nr:ribonuclease HIII [Sporomusaceae bacterium]